jgi:Helix-turn-helix domain of resolvase/Resolvase, N terminal domain
MPRPAAAAPPGGRIVDARFTAVPPTVSIRTRLYPDRLRFSGDESPMATFMLSVMGAFAEFERALLRERQREGIALAKRRGVYRGRKKALSPSQATHLRQRAHAGEAKAQLAREFGISRETLYQYLRESREVREVRKPTASGGRKPSIEKPDRNPVI